MMVLGAEQADDERLLSPLDDADVIYFTGGNPGHLLETLSGSLLLRKLRMAYDGGAVIAGSSAGAMVMGSWMRFDGWKEALAIVPGVATLPHHEKSDPGKVADQLRGSAPQGIAVLGIDAGTCCFAGAEGWEVLGAGAVTVYDGAGWRRYQSGKPLALDAPVGGTGP